MYRAGIRELRIAKRSYAGRYYTYARNITSSVVSSFVESFGPDEFVESLAEPYFLDFLTALCGLDEVECDRTLVMSAILKEVLTPSMAVAVLGGSNISRFDVPAEMEKIAAVFNLSDRWVKHLIYCSRMVAKVDSVAIQDGYELYLHVMFLTRGGMWTIIQQSKEPFQLRARRYHWFSGRVRSFVDEPHNGILTEIKKPAVLDMTAKKSAEARLASVELTHYDISKLKRLQTHYSRLYKQSKLDGKPDEVIEVIAPTGKVNWSVLRQLREYPPKTYEELLSFKGVGKEIVKFLALGSIIYFNAEPSFDDPAMLSYEIQERYGSKEMLWRVQQLVDAVNSSNLSVDMRRKCLSRLNALFGGTEAIGG